MTNPYLVAGLPPDSAAWIVFLVAIVLLLAVIAKREPVTQLCLRVSTRTVLLGLSLGAAALSALYVKFYLRGGPRIIDATSYLLEARAIANGYFSFPIPTPSGSFRGRFLVSPEGGDTLGVIFPPGYPTLLALGELAGAPLIIGPLIACGLVVSTYFLARALTEREDIARLAAALSVICAALRYHTADTMSHGLSALLFTTALFAITRNNWRFSVLSGLCLGLLCATRPVTAFAASALIFVFFVRRHNVLALILGAVPGVLLLLVHQRAVTGSWFDSTQLRYYALSDGPPGCFRYGFGSGIGCHFEHGDFVRARLGEGYGFREAFGNTLRRLAVHTLDIANAAPLALVALYAAVRTFRRRSTRLLVIGIVGTALAYAPFYFEASYPGGGARLLADVLPLEHVLVAFGLCELKIARFALPVALFGFSLHTSYAHNLLKDREGGHPMFEADVLEAANVQRGLVFVTTDHGFNLGHQPGVVDARRGLVVARWRNDAHDHLLWDALGRPQSFIYRFDVVRGTAKLDPYEPPQTDRLEAEAEWPLLSVTRGWAHPDFVPCASGGRGLRLHGSPEIQIELPTPKPGDYDVHVGWVVQRERGHPAGLIASLALDGGAPQVATANVSEEKSRAETCVEVVFRKRSLDRPRARATLSLAHPDAIFDYIHLQEPVALP